MKELNRKIKVLKCLVVFILVFGFMKISYAQDVIIKNDNSTIECKVLKISNSEIEYKKWTNLDGPIYTIDVEDVIRIDYQNGESENFNDCVLYDNIRGFMTRDHCDLVLNGRVLSDEEVKSLFGNKGYETYVGAKKQMHASELWGFIFALSLIGDAAGLSGMIHWNTEDDRLKSTALFSGSLLLTNVSIPLMCVFRGVGKGRLNWLVDDFNERHNNSMSFSIVPSLMNCEMPQLQNNYGVGLTIKMKF